MSDERVEGERQIEMFWRCNSCAVLNRGRHLKCQGCGNPKDGTEDYLMPDDPAVAESVTDEKLLKLATAGANWRCRFCGGDARALNNTCQACGAKIEESAPAAEPASAVDPEAARLDKELTALGIPDDPSTYSYESRHERARAAVAKLEAEEKAEDAPPKRAWWKLGLGLVALLGLLPCMCMGLVGRGHVRLPAAVQAKVERLRWERHVVVERFGPQVHEGFAEARPAAAYEVVSLGPRFHHNLTVPDGFRTEHYTETVADGYRSESYTETVSDGTRSESYTDREACGQDCTPTAKSCKEQCTSNKNGFASCKTVCTGGGQKCSTKYCSVTKHRDTPKTKTVTRTRQVPRTREVDRTRAVPKTKEVPQLAEAFRWKVDEWATDRELSETGEDAHPRWPAAPAEDGKTVRWQKREHYEVRLENRGAPDDLPQAYRLEVEDEGAFSRFAPGSLQWLWAEDSLHVRPLAGPPADGGVAWAPPAAPR